jgi:hypothetical protein
MPLSRNQFGVAVKRLRIAQQGKRMGDIMSAQLFPKQMPEDRAARFETFIKGLGDIHRMTNPEENNGEQK